MLPFKSKDKYLRTKYIINLSTLVPFLLFSIVLFFICLVALNKDFSTSHPNFFTYCLFGYGCLGAILIIILIIPKWLVKRHYKNMWILEMMEIAYKKYLQSLPKVVFVYTVHNDFQPTRLLQSMQQTYKNFEVWISDGSSKIEISNAIKEFASKNNIHLFKMNTPSVDKADNLNTFLKTTKVKFDYLLFSDSDVAIHKEFVATALNYFYNPNFKHVGYVSSYIQNYPLPTLFSKYTHWTETSFFYLSDVFKNLGNNAAARVWSSCCLIKKDVLDELGGFPSGSLEDLYIELDASKLCWAGLVCPLTTSMQHFDRSESDCLRRLLRVHDWAARYFNTKQFKKYNDQYHETYDQIIGYTHTGLYALLGIIGAGVIVPTIVIFAPIIFTTNGVVEYINIFQILAIVIPVGTALICASIVGTVNAMHIIGFWRGIICAPFGLFWVLNFSIHFIYHYFKATVRKKYTTFKETRQARENETSGKKKIAMKAEWIILACTIPVLVLANTLFFYFNALHLNTDHYDQYKYFWYLILFIDITVGYLLFAAISGLLLQAASKIKVKDLYPEDKFVYNTNKVTDFRKVKDKFYKQHPEYERRY